MIVLLLAENCYTPAMDSPVAITAFYKFFDIAEDQLTNLQEELRSFGKKHGMRGLTLLATEGINGTVCGTPEVIARWKELIQHHAGDVVFKDASADTVVFPRWFVKIRQEIVSLRQPDVEPDGKRNHLTPEEWNAMLEQDDVVVLDTRNVYETEIGMFENAIDPKIQNFQEFSDYVKKGEIAKDKKVMMYCTGGIRCEKALIEMQKQGYEHVYQLEGGILAYLQKFPEQKFAGECFVFDHRVSVDQHLQPSERYKTCPHCGNPGDKAINCTHCDARCAVCVHCLEDKQLSFCSKDCRHRASLVRS